MDVKLEDGVEYTFRSNQGDGDRKEKIRDLILAPLDGGSVIAAQLESEVPIYHGGGLQLMTSPTLMGLNVLRRQVKKVGDLNGPLTIDQLKQVSPRDMAILQIAAEKLDEAMANTEGLASRGRNETAQSAG